MNVSKTWEFNCPQYVDFNKLPKEDDEKDLDLFFQREHESHMKHILKKKKRRTTNKSMHKENVPPILENEVVPKKKSNGSASSSEYLTPPSSLPSENKNYGNLYKLSPQRLMKKVGESIEADVQIIKNTENKRHSDDTRPSAKKTRLNKIEEYDTIDFPVKNNISDGHSKTEKPIPKKKNILAVSTKENQNVLPKKERLMTRSFATNRIINKLDILNGHPKKSKDVKISALVTSKREKSEAQKPSVLSLGNKKASSTATNTMYNFQKSQLRYPLRKKLASSSVVTAMPKAEYKIPLILPTRRIKKPITPECLKRTRNKKPVKSTEELEMEKILMLREKLSEHCKLSRQSMKKAISSSFNKTDSSLRTFARPTTQQQSSIAPTAIIPIKSTIRNNQSRLPLLVATQKRTPRKNLTKPPATKAGLPGNKKAEPIKTILPRNKVEPTKIVLLRDKTAEPTKTILSRNKAEPIIAKNKIEPTRNRKVEPVTTNKRTRTPAKITVINKSKPFINKLDAVRQNKTSIKQAPKFQQTKCDKVQLKNPATSYNKPAVMYEPKNRNVISKCKPREKTPVKQRRNIKELIAKPIEKRRIGAVQPMAHVGIPFRPNLEKKITIVKPFSFDNQGKRKQKADDENNSKKAKLLMMKK